MNKSQAIRQVAKHVAGLLTAGDLEESTGLMDDEIETDADRERLEDAVEVVADRLYRMGSE